MKTRTWVSLLLYSVVSAFLSAGAIAQQDPPLKPQDPAAQQGLLPIPEFGGSWLDRAYLTGDWGGARDALAEAGIQFDLEWMQYVQGVSHGGLDTGTEYGGTVSTRLKLDLMRMGVMPGALVDVRALSRYENFIGARSGQVLPVNANGIAPLTSPPYDDIFVAVTNLTYTQYLSESVAAYVGKIDLLDGDQNEFATGRGASQFMNYNFVFAAPTALVPASALGAGVLFAPDKQWSVASTLLSSTDTSTTVGFDDIDGGISATEARFQYRLGDLPGGTNGSFVYFFSTDLVDLNSRLDFPPGEGPLFRRKDHTWIAVFSGWQYLYTEEAPGQEPLNLANGRPDLQGVGLFGRIAFADKDTNPWKFTFSVGVGGRGIVPTRDDDVFGVGYYYADVDPDRFSGPLNFETRSQGFEAFYNIALTPAVHLTFDAQVLDTALPGADTAVVLGLRLKTDF